MKNTFLKTIVLFFLLTGFSYISKAQAFYYNLIVTNNSGCSLNFITYDNSMTQMGLGFVSAAGSGTTNVCTNPGVMPYAIYITDGAGNNCTVTLGYGVFPTTWTGWSFDFGCTTCTATNRNWRTSGVSCGPPLSNGFTIEFNVN